MAQLTRAPAPRFLAGVTFILFYCLLGLFIPPELAIGLQCFGAVRESHSKTNIQRFSIYTYITDICSKVRTTYHIMTPIVTLFRCLVIYAVRSHVDSFRIKSPSSGVKSPWRTLGWAMDLLLPRPSWAAEGPPGYDRSRRCVRPLTSARSGRHPPSAEEYPVGIAARSG